MRKPSLFFVLLAYSSMLAAATMTSEQFAHLVDQGKFVIGVWQSFIVALVVGLATFLWRRIAKNEDDFRSELKDTNQNLRHRVSDLHQAIHGSSSMLIDQSRIHEERMHQLLEKVEELRMEQATIRERLREIEMRKAQS